jgi:hypothetical protein
MHTMCTGEDKMTQQVEQPKGALREQSASTRVTIGGAPISYVALFAAALGVTALIPFMIMTTGKAFPVSELLTALAGIVLGPVGGFVAGLVGGAIGLVIAPYTAANGILAPLTPALGAMAAGYFVQRTNKKWLGVLILTVALAVFTFKGLVINRVTPAYWLFLAVIVAWISLLIAVTPLQTLAANWLRSKNVTLLVVGVAIVTFMGTCTAMIVNNAIGIWLFQTPNDIWPVFVPIVTGERALITVAGTVLSVAVILGLRRLRLVRPTEGGWYED